MVTEDRTPMGFLKIEHQQIMRPIVRAKLQRAGMSHAGIAALAAGKTITDKKDIAIVAAIVANALK